MHDVVKSQVIFDVKSDLNWRYNNRNDPNSFFHPDSIFFLKTIES